MSRRGSAVAAPFTFGKDKHCIGCNIIKLSEILVLLILKEKDQPMNQTIDYYNKHAAAFVDSTLNADMTTVRNVFTASLPADARILDLGCGSGRDSLAFKQAGFTVEALDGSPVLAEAAYKTAGVPVYTMEFHELDFQERYDGIFACASLLHLPKKELPGMFNRISNALKEDGIFYCSFKYGTFEGMRNGRYFSDLDEESFRQFIETSGCFEIQKLWLSQDVRKERKEIWLNALLQKRTGASSSAPTAPKTSCSCR